MLTEAQVALGQCNTVPLAMLLPHELVSAVYHFDRGIFFSVFAGLPGDLERYWAYNSDLASALGMTWEDAWFNSIVHTSKEYRSTIPLRLYGDGAEAQRHFELLSILPIMSVSGSTLDSRVLISVRNSTKTGSEARRSTLEVVAWSFQSLRVSATFWF